MKEITRLLLVKILLLVTLGFIPVTGFGLAHPDHTSEELSELNDYLMALQMMRHQNTEAEELFQRWQELREASWKIRELTDEEDLDINDPVVEEQIDQTHRLRKALLEDSRSFFRRQTNSLPVARIHLGDSLLVSWNQEAVNVPVGSRMLVLMEITSDRSHHSKLHLTGESDDQILFWSKPVTITKDHPRYTFVYLAPLAAGLAESSVSVQWREDEIRELTFQANGTLPATYDWYNHVPDESMYNMAHDQNHKTEPEATFDSNNKPIRFRIRDPETGKPMPVRVEVRDEEGQAYWTPLRGPSYAVDRENAGWETPLWTFQPGPFFYIDGDAELGVDPSGKTAEIYHGFEYEPVIMEIPDDGVVEAVPERWIDMPSKGWYSGHTHIHTTDVGLPVQYSRFWPLVTRAEDLGVSSILTLQGERKYHAIYADEYPMGPLESHSTSENLITYGQEYRNNPYGHLALLGLEELIMPVSSGALGEIGGPDYPPNRFILDKALSQGATTIGAHFGNYIMGDKSIVTSWPSSGFELPVNVALGKVHLAEIYGNAGQQEVWYKLLNTGFDIPATAGPDWVMRDTPRVYVYLGNKPFSVENWLESLRQGRSFITRGPMLFFTLDGEMPGSQLHFSERKKTVTVHASALTPDGSRPVEIVVNGEIVASGTGLEQTIELQESSWIAARTEGAHSNPVFVTLRGQSRSSEEDAEAFITITERLKEWVKTKGLFENAGQKETVLKALEDGRRIFEDKVEHQKGQGKE